MPFYHVWFATKRRKWLLMEEIAEMVKEQMRMTAQERDIRLLECETMVDHVHLLIECTDRAHLGRTMNFLKGASARRVFQQFPELKLDAEIGRLWQHRYGVKEVPLEAATTVGNYIRTQWDRLEKYER